MNLNPTRRTFVWGLLAFVGFVRGMASEPRVETQFVATQEKPALPVFIVQMRQPPMPCATYVYDSTGSKR